MWPSTVDYSIPINQRKNGPDDNVLQLPIGVLDLQNAEYRKPDV